MTSLTGNGPEWRNTPVVVSISGTKSSGAGPSGVVSVGGEVEVTIAANVEVVVTSFVIHSYPLTCKGSEYGGDAHGDCVADPRIVPADPSNLAEYRDTWVGTRAFAEKERLSIESGPLRACVAVVDAAGNRGSTCAELGTPGGRTTRIPRHAHRRRANRDVHRRPRRDVRARKGVVAASARVPDGSGAADGDVKTGTPRTRPRATPRFERADAHRHHHPGQRRVVGRTRDGVVQIGGRFATRRRTAAREPGDAGRAPPPPSAVLPRSSRPSSK